MYYSSSHLTSRAAPLGAHIAITPRATTIVGVGAEPATGLLAASFLLGADGGDENK